MGIVTIGSDASFACGLDDPRSLLERPGAGRMQHSATSKDPESWVLGEGTGLGESGCD